MAFPKSAKVKVIKTKLAEKHGLTISEIKLISKGKVLKDHLPISDFKLSEADIINFNIPQKQEA